MKSLNFIIYLFLSLLILTSVLSFMAGFKTGKSISVSVGGNLESVKENRIAKNFFSIIKTATDKESAGNKKGDGTVKKSLKSSKTEARKIDISELDIEITNTKKISENYPYTIQLYATSSLKNVKKRFFELKNKIDDMYIFKEDKQSAQNFFIRSGPYRSRYNAIKDLEKLRVRNGSLTGSLITSK